MKILFYINAIHHGGAERVITKLAQDFAKVGNECILVTSFRDSWEYPVDKIVKRIILCDKKINGFIIRNLKLTLLLRKILKEEKPNIAISFMAEPNFRLLIANFLLKTKTIISVRNDPNKEYGNSFFKILAKTLFVSADGIVFQTNQAKQWFPGKIQMKSKIIANPIDDIFIKTEIKENAHDIITTGRLVPQKNHALLIKAYANIADCIDENLVIYGDGELKDSLLNLAAELNIQSRVMIPGPVKDVASVLSEAKVFVLSSDFEGMPNSLMEAMAVGVPCISTKCPCGGPEFLITDGENGYLVEVNDDKALSQKLVQVLNDPNIKVLGKKAKESTKRFSNDEIFKEWASYVDVLAEKDLKRKKV